MGEVRQLSRLGRRIRGEWYPAFANWLNAADIAYLRGGKVRCRMWRDVTYVHEADHDMATRMMNDIWPGITQPAATAIRSQGHE